jgi:hypothetical protein
MKGVFTTILLVFALCTAYSAPIIAKDGKAGPPTLAAPYAKAVVSDVNFVTKISVDFVVLEIYTVTGEQIRQVATPSVLKYCETSGSASLMRKPVLPDKHWRHRINNLNTRDVFYYARSHVNKRRTAGARQMLTGQIKPPLLLS